MAFSDVFADAAVDMIAAVGEPCTVHNGGHVYSDDGAGGPLLVQVETAMPGGPNSFGVMTEITLMHIASKTLTDQGMKEPCEGMLIVFNAKDDKRGGEFVGGRYGGCTYHVDKVESEQAQTWTFHVTKQ